MSKNFYEELGYTTQQEYEDAMIDSPDDVTAKHVAYTERLVAEKLAEKTQEIETEKSKLTEKETALSEKEKRYEEQEKRMANLESKLNAMTGDDTTSKAQQKNGAGAVEGGVRPTLEEPQEKSLPDKLIEANRKQRQQTDDEFV